MGDLYTVKPSKRIEESRRIDARAIEHERLRQEIKNQAIWPLGFAFQNTSDTLGGGLRSGDFTVIHGDTGTGLTTLVANLAVSLVSAKVHTVVFPLQKSGSDFGKKLDVAVKYLLKDSDNIDDYLSVVEGDSRNMGVFPIDLTRYIQKQHTENKKNVFIVDNINWVSRASWDSKNKEEAIKEIRSLCDRTPIHVVLIMYSGPFKSKPELRWYLPPGEKRDIGGLNSSCHEVVDNILFFGKQGGTNRFLQFDKIKSNSQKQLTRHRLNTTITDVEVEVFSPGVFYSDLNTVFTN